MKLEKKKELLLKVDSLTSQHELIKKKIDSNSTITQNLGLRLKEYSTRKKHEKVYKDKSSLRTIISSIKSQIKNRRQIELDLSKIKLLYEKSSSSFNDIINKHLFPKTKNVSILDKTDTKYEFSDIIAIAKFYKAQFLNLKKNWDSFSLEISILIRRPKNFSNIPLKIYLTILALVLLMIARKLITVNIRNKFLYMESLNKRLWNDDYKWRDITISMLRILKKGVPFLMTLISLLIITFVLHLNKSVFSMLLFLYFSIFLYYLLKYIIIEILIPDKLISKHIFFYTHIFFLISLIFLNFINITQIMAPEININILY
ncbi:hypothetical protein KAJ27_25825, partial [bacterium]|nr:hypothetical protein [bacterium]